MRSLTRVPALAVGAVVLVGSLLLSACSSPGPTTAAASNGAAPSGAATAGLVSSTVAVDPAFATAPFDEPRQAAIPAGWSMSVWARVPDVRLATWSPDGALIVSVPSAGQVLRLVPSAGGPPQTSVLIDGLDQPHGLAFAGSTLYVAQSNRVDAWTYGGGSVTASRPVVTGLPDAKSPDLHGAYAHALKSVAVGRDGSVYVSVGSTANISPQDRDASPQRAAILRVPPGAPPNQPPEAFARGVRNGTGLAVAPDGAVWTAVNNRDNIAFPLDQPYGGGGGASARGQVIQSYVNDHPPEELARLTPGRDLGWPFCNPDPDVRPGVPGSPQVKASPRYERDQQTNADGSKLDCSTLAPVEQTMGAHSAPLGLSFTSSALPDGFGGGALVGIHGSWNRDPQRAPEVSFFPEAGDGLGNQRTLVGGFQAPDQSRWGRPVAAVQGPDRAIYITDDQAGAIYRLAPSGS